ncbi:FAD-dependent oxidoreductase [Nocardia carnea]|uniref:FAD-dependent oxidoreductase n=1 Tax=Nocardia carnea TaxID=37328 RepID=UPI00245384CF|nr:FAD-dependent oxidoreductase [Nocardia carnea]
MDDEFDVIVIGGGGAGLAAAVSAAEDGASVLLLEYQRELGGSTQLSAGLFTAAGTSVQRALGIEDSPEKFFQHYMDLNQWVLRPGLIHAFCENAGPTLEWLIGLGLEVPAAVSGNAHQPGLTRAGVEDVWRGHVPKDQGYGLVQVLAGAARAHGIEVVLGTRVEKLLVEQGRVAGVVADGIDMRAGAVVVASGGFAQDPAFVDRYFPDTREAGDSLFVVAAPGSRGDHLRFGEDAGASLTGHGWGLLMPTVYFQRYHHWQSGFPPASRIYVNSQGRRFMDEDASYAVSTGILDQHGGYAWMIFDEKARTGLAPGYTDWTAERVAEEVAAGRTVQAGSRDGLAAAIGVPAAALRTSIDRWNAEVPAGHDTEFRRHVSLAAKGVTTPLDPIETGPFYAARILPAELVCTHTGLEIDAHAAVLDTTGAPVAGLFAAGEAGGGVLGQRYVGGGNAVANALTMGRIAGRSAALASRTLSNAQGR